MNIKRSLMISAVFLLIALAAGVWLYPQLPAQVPVHWNIHGDIDRYWPRFWAMAMPALMVFAVAVLSLLFMAISPRKFAITPFAGVFMILMLATEATVLVIGLTVLLSGAGYHVSAPRIAMLALGVLSMIAGNYTGKLRKNFFIGIRTPWTLASDAVWERTHRLAGWLFMLGGLIAVVATLVGAPYVVAIAAIVIAGLVACVYSFVIYRRLEGRHT